MTDPSQGMLLYHLTHIDNVASILRYGLMSRKDVEENRIYFKDIADQEIIKGRKELNAGLLQGVLFHFFAKNPFDGAVCLERGSKNMAIITIRRSLHERQEFYVIPSHPLDREIPEMYPYDEGVKKVRWDILDDKANRDYHDPEIKKACMAECITTSKIEPENIAYIYVYDEYAKQKIERELGRVDYRISVNPYMFP